MRYSSPTKLRALPGIVSGMVMMLTYRKQFAVEEKNIDRNDIMVFSPCDKYPSKHL